jgi:hypothetical protein
MSTGRAATQVPDPAWERSGSLEEVYSNLEGACSTQRLGR